MQALSHALALLAGIAILLVFGLAMLSALGGILLGVLGVFIGALAPLLAIAAVIALSCRLMIMRLAARSSGSPRAG